MFCNRVSSLLKNISASDVDGGRYTEAIWSDWQFDHYIDFDSFGKCYNSKFVLDSQIFVHLIGNLRRN